jgi:hypothetical protein
MSSRWKYQLLVEPGRLTSQRLRAIIAVAGSFGFHDRDVGVAAAAPINGMSEDGDELKFESLDAAIDYLSDHGGLLTLWHHRLGIDIEVTLRPADVGQPVFSSPGYEGIDTQRFDVLAFSVTGGTYRIHDEQDREEAEEREELSRILKQLFVAWARTSHAIYGILLNTDLAELSIMRLSLHEAAAARHPSPVLGWLNYFGPPYAAALDLALFHQVGAGIDEVEGGVLVALGRYPWEIKISEMARINEEWRALTDPAGESPHRSMSAGRGA